MDLGEVPIPFSDPSKIKDHESLANRERKSLFQQRRFYGWWPVIGRVKVDSTGSSKKKEKITKLTVGCCPLYAVARMNIKPDTFVSVLDYLFQYFDA